VFALSGLLDGVAPLPSMPRTGDGYDLRQLAGKEYRFPVPSVPAVRLPRKSSTLDELLKGAGAEAPFCWAALTAPAYRIPLLSPTGERRAALVVACQEGDKAAVAAVMIGLRPGPQRHSPPEITEHSLDIARDQDDMIDLME
jgi:hypothetical protein